MQCKRIDKKLVENWPKIKLPNEYKYEEDIVQYCVATYASFFPKLDLQFNIKFDIKDGLGVPGRYILPSPRDMQSGASEGVIELNGDILKDVSDKQLKTTVLHELAHYVDFVDKYRQGKFWDSGHNTWNAKRRDADPHGKSWEEIAKIVGQITGITLSKKDHTATIEYGRREAIPPKYVLWCQNCGEMFKYFDDKKTDVLRHPENYLCGKCYGPLKLVL